MEKYFTNIIKSVGENPEREGLKNTPRRAAQAMRFLTQGYHINIHELVNNALFESRSDEIIIVKNIELYSLCEHHLLPFIGKCHIGYLPNGKVLGLSKVARLVNVFARRLQLQERLTKQIADSVMTSIDAKGVGVILEAQHLCMMMRGIGK